MAQRTLSVPLSAVLALVCAAWLAAGADIPDDCQQQWFTQRLDHFRWHKGEQPTFQQRYFVCDKHWSASPSNGQRGPIFFYAGNESPVTAYMKSAGLMFENRESFGALVVFIEHRYYGETQPFGPDSWKVDPSYLTVEQAMVDYTALLYNLTQSMGAAGSPIIAFGGSYGGMLAAYMRRRYPHIIAGAVAASAPVGQFPAIPGFTPSAFWDVVTRDASPAAGAAADCVDNTREAFKQLLAAGKSPEGRQQLQQAFRLCGPLSDEGDAFKLAYWAQGAFDAFAMGNYPFASDYMTGEGQGELPAWPMRAACERMSNLAPAAHHTSAATADGDGTSASVGRSSTGSGATSTSSAGGNSGTSQARTHKMLGRRASAAAAAAAAAAPAPPAVATRAGAQAPARQQQQQQEPGELLVKLMSAASLLYNASGTVGCYSLDLAGPAAGSVGAWDYQVCTQFLGQELPYFPASANSMFWDQGPFDWGAIVQHCKDTWGVEPSYTHMTVEHGGLDWSGVSNIVFSNGLLDPWSVFGVLEDVSDDVVAVVIPEGAHHLDLMYSRPDDSAELKQARTTILQHVEAWIENRPVPTAGSGAKAGSGARGAPVTTS